MLPRTLCTRIRIPILVGALCWYLSFSCAGLSLVELCNINIPRFTRSLAVSNEGTMAIVEDAGAVLAIYSSGGIVHRRWSAPAGNSFSYCEIGGEYVLATYGKIVSLFSDYGRVQDWEKGITDLWGTACSLDIVGHRVVVADYPLGDHSTVWSFDFDGNVLWQYRMPSHVTDTAVSRSGYVAVAGENYGFLYDEGDHAVYMLSAAGAKKWSFETESPVIDIALSGDGKHVLAGLDNGGMLFLESRTRLLGLRAYLLWEMEDVGGYVDLAVNSGIIAATTRDMSLVLMNGAGEQLWRSATSDIFGDRDEICISADGDVIAAIGGAMKLDNNPVRIFDSLGNILYEEFTSLTRPSVAVSPNGRYIAVAAGFILRLFEVLP